MALETFGYIKDLVATNPAGTDPKSQGDDHLRGVKSTLKNQFPGLTEGVPVTVTESQLNSTKAVAQLTGRNLLINGGFDVWERGAGSTSIATSAFAADRWKGEIGTTTGTVTRVTMNSNGDGLADRAMYAAAVAFTSGGTAASFLHYSQKIEDGSITAGKQVSLSFYAKGSTALKIGVELVRMRNGVITSLGNVFMTPLTTGWAKYSTTFTVPNLGASLPTLNTDYLAVRFWMDAGANYSVESGGVGNQSGTITMTNVQLELGAVATPFEYKPRSTIIAECQRYYQDSGTSGTAFVLLATHDYRGWTFPVQMFKSPTFTFQFSTGSGGTFLADNTGFRSNSANSAISSFTWQADAEI